MSRSAPTNGSDEAEASGHRSRNSDPRRRGFMERNPHERIQSATARTITSQGYAASTVEDICAEAGISEKVFYEHFKSKQEAAMSALETSVDQVMLELRERLSTQPRPGLRPSGTPPRPSSIGWPTSLPSRALRLWRCLPPARPRWNSCSRSWTPSRCSWSLAMRWLPSRPLPGVWSTKLSPMLILGYSTSHRARGRREP